MSSQLRDNSPMLTKRPQDSRFKQQKLPAWQPIITAQTILPLLFITGLIFIPLGIILLVTSNNIEELMIDYTEKECMSSSGKTCLEMLKKDPSTPCNCQIFFELKKPFLGDVYLYYGLTNFYQNHRRYVKSRDDHQLLGRPVDNYKQLNSDCEPFRDSNKTFSVAPCGAIANSLFNDTFKLKMKHGNSSVVDVNLLNTGIAWTTDKSTKFHNPPGFSSNPAKAFNGTVKPPNWQKPVYELDLSNPSNNGYENEDLIVWMRTAALPNFRKLHRRLKREGLFEEGLPKGHYILEIQYAYPTWSFQGFKQVFLTTTSWIGGKNPFLGVTYLVVGSLCFLHGFFFLFVHLKFHKNKRSLNFGTIQGF